MNYEAEIKLLKVKIPDVNEIPAIKFTEAKELIAREYHREIKDYADFEPEEERLLYGQESNLLFEFGHSMLCSFQSISSFRPQY